MPNAQENFKLEHFCLFFLLCTPITHAYASDTQAIFVSVKEKYQAIFEHEAQNLLEKNLESLSQFLTSKASKSVFIVHDFSDEDEKRLKKLDFQLKRAGIRTLLDCVDCGGNLTIHQFNDQIFHERVNAIIAVGTGQWKDTSRHDLAQLSDNTITALKQKKEPLILLAPCDKDKADAFSSMLLNVSNSNFVQYPFAGSITDVHKLYELINVIYDNKLNETIRKYEQNFSQGIKSIGGK